jgi:hypothetical protein
MDDEILFEGATSPEPDAGVLDKGWWKQMSYWHNPETGQNP